MRAFALFLAAVTMALAGCGGATETLTVTVTAATPSVGAPVETAEGDTAPADQSGFLSIGETGRDGSLEFTLTKSLTVTDAVPVKQYEMPIRAQAGAELVVAPIGLLNDDKGSVDIYCAYDLGASLVDVSGRHFDLVDSLYRVAGNTDCNQLVQPGFQTTETLVFKTPAGVQVSELDLWDPNQDDDAFGEQSAVRFKATP